MGLNCAEKRDQAALSPPQGCSCHVRFKGSSPVLSPAVSHH